MRIASPAHLSLRLDRNLAWRKKELTQLKLIADSAVIAAANVLRRSAIALLYAHWEGFIKDASVYYLTYLADAPLNLGTLTPSFVAIALGSDIRLSGRANKTSVHSKLVDLVRSLDQPPPTMKRLPTKGVILTKSNLKSAVLREIVATLGIDYSAFALKEKPVIDRLVKSRNMIAHGGGVPVTGADYAFLHAEVIALMDIYKDLIEDAANNNRHIR